LISLGANLQFADRLHMKVYWSEGSGVVVTSANLSTNALGVGDLKEAGVLLGPESLDIDNSLRRWPCAPQHLSFTLLIWRIATTTREIPVQTETPRRRAL